MRPATESPISDQGSLPAPGLSPATHWPTHPEIEPHERRNIALLALHQIVLRVGWIFKTESVIMPAFLDFVGPGAGWIRGFMPLLSRFGQSVPPVICADWFRARRHKKYSLCFCVVAMSMPFGVLAAVCLMGDAREYVWMPALFLAMYGLFFVFHGLYQLAFGTTQGKLIRPTRRGLLLLISTSTGTIPAILIAWLLLPRWLALPEAGFGYQFTATMIGFLLAGVVALLLFEPADAARHATRIRFVESLQDTWTTLRGDRNLRRLVSVAVLFGAGLILFPHYQALAREELGMDLQRMVVWVIVQSASVGVLSLFVGPLADLMGNRLTLRTLILASSAAPFYAASLASGDAGSRLFWLVFIPLGTFPLVLRILANYALEICEPTEHARYLSTVSLCLAVPFLLSPAVGGLIDLVGFTPVFFTAGGLILCGGLLTFTLAEPRHGVLEPDDGTIAPGVEE